MVGHSRATSVKQRHYEMFLRMHMQIIKGMMLKGKCDPLYHLFDITAGRGIDPDTNEPGSALIALMIAEELALPVQAYFIEQNSKDVLLLRDNIRGFAVDKKIICGNHTEWLPLIAEEFQDRPTEPFCNGLIYCDPNGMIGHDSIEAINSIINLRCFHRLDVLMNINATAYLRTRGAGKSDRYLLDELRDLNKSNFLIRQPIDQWLWTFIIGTNWSGFPIMEKQGFHPLRTPQGRQILAKLNLSDKERRQHEPGFFGPSPTGVIGNTYNIPDSLKLKPQSSVGRKASANVVISAPQLSLTIFDTPNGEHSTYRKT